METDNRPDETAGKTKVCPHCGQEKPLTEYHRNVRAADGVQTYCIACKKEMDSARNKAKAVGGGRKLRPLFTNPELARFTPNQLINELKARGFHGKITYLNEIIL